MNDRDTPTELQHLSPVRFATLSTHERVLDRLADVMSGADEILEMLKGPDAVHLYWTEPHLQKIYDDVNAIMRKLCD